MKSINQWVLIAVIAYLALNIEHFQNINNAFWGGVTYEVESRFKAKQKHDDKMMEAYAPKVSYGAPIPGEF